MLSSHLRLVAAAAAAAAAAATVAATVVAVSERSLIAYRLLFTLLTTYL